MFIKPVNGDFNYQSFWCPGCKCVHIFTINGVKNEFGSTWKWNGLQEEATLDIPVRIEYENRDQIHLVQRCEAQIKNGRIKFSKECTHRLKGQEVPLEEF